MLIAPIFHNSYLSPKSLECQNKSSETVSSAKANDAGPAKYNNIFKSALNRSITFFSKITNSSGSTTPSSSISKPIGSEQNHGGSSSETSSDCSSPDSLKTEMIFFKPITREPRTPSSTKSVLLRVPPVRTTSSRGRCLSSPCPSPFFIPIAAGRQSAFSFVGLADDYSRDSEDQSTEKLRHSKRKSSKSSPEKPNQKRFKSDKQEAKAEKPRSAKAETKTRRTREVGKKEKDNQNFTKPSVPVQRKKATKSNSSLKKELKDSPQAFEVVKRVTRSQSLKH